MNSRVNAVAAVGATAACLVGTVGSVLFGGLGWERAAANRAGFTFAFLFVAVILTLRYVARLESQLEADAKSARSSEKARG